MLQPTEAQDFFRGFLTRLIEYLDPRLIDIERTNIKNDLIDYVRIRRSESYEVTHTLLVLFQQIERRLELTNRK